MTIRSMFREIRAHRAARKTPALTPGQDAALAALAPDVAGDVDADVEAAIQARITAARDADIWALAAETGLDHRRDRLYLESAVDTGVVPLSSTRGGAQ